MTNADKVGLLLIGLLSGVVGVALREWMGSLDIAIFVVVVMHGYMLQTMLERNK